MQVEIKNVDQLLQAIKDYPEVTVEQWMKVIEKIKGQPVWADENTSKEQLIVFVEEYRECLQDKDIELPLFFPDHWFSEEAIQDMNNNISDEGLEYGNLKDKTLEEIVDIHGKIKTIISKNQSK